jgi:tetratricopeptide (TPR) repeat protein
MRAFVFTDEALRSQAGRFVWLDLDMEKARNAGARKRLALEALPTYYVVDPRDGSVAMKYVGAMTVPQLKRFLDDARLAVERRGEPRGDTPADAALARADRLYGAGENAGAVREYRAALAAAPADWPPYARAVESLLFACDRTGETETCAMTALEALPRLGHTASAGLVAASGLGCAAALPDSHPRRAEWLRALLGPARAVVADSAVAMAADDRSGLYIAIGDAHGALGDSLGERATGEAWSAFLDGAAARARTAEERTVFDSHRLSAYMALGRVERAVPMLEASERDLPDDYNPPARLAIAYRELKRWDEGLAASDRAMARAYGPRKLNLFNVRVDLYDGKGDRAATRRTLEEALAYAKALPAGQRSAGAIAALEKRLAALPPATP